VNLEGGTKSCQIQNPDRNVPKAIAHHVPMQYLQLTGLNTLEANPSPDFTAFMQVLFFFA